MRTFPATLPDPGRGVYCNRTLNLRSIRAIGYDMDYTLVHYKVAAWEGQAYEHIRRKLAAMGWPVDDLVFDALDAARGLIVDRELGNLLKVNRFGYVKRAAHGTKVMDYRTLKRTYARTIVDLSEDRYYFLNTLFSISEAAMYAQLVDRLDEELIPDVETYDELYAHVRSALDAAHIEGVLKAEIMGSPETYVDSDPLIARALLDQHEAGKRLVLITNSEWEYTRFMMSYAFDRYLPGSMTWRELFELVIVSARKPLFFSARNPMLRVVEETGHLSPFLGPLERGAVYFGGSASRVEQYLGVSGDHILYVGDHLFADVSLSKSLLRWRTALVMRELEDEIRATYAQRASQDQIDDLMAEKEALEDEYSQTKLAILRAKSQGIADALTQELPKIRASIVELDNEIAPLVIADSRVSNPKWGYLMRAGNDKSDLARQMESYADIYTSRVSNLAYYTPFVFFRAPRGSIPHDPEPGESIEDW